jgi:hypothetical protein
MRFHSCTLGTSENRIGIASKTGTIGDSSGNPERWVSSCAAYAVSS